MPTTIHGGNTNNGCSLNICTKPNPYLVGGHCYEQLHNVQYVYCNCVVGNDTTLYWVFIGRELVAVIERWLLYRNGNVWNET